MTNEWGGTVTGPDLGSGNMEFDSPSLDVNRSIISTDAVEFAHNSLSSMYQLVRDGMTKKQRDEFEKHLKHLKDKAHRSRAYDDGGYFQEQLEELDEDY